MEVSGRSEDPGRDDLDAATSDAMISRRSRGVLEKKSTKHQIHLSHENGSVNSL